MVDGQAEDDLSIVIPAKRSARRDDKVTYLSFVMPWLDPLLSG